jgi:hypothetical protein
MTRVVSAGDKDDTVLSTFTRIERDVSSTDEELVGFELLEVAEDLSR